jgi:hypothetical protein
MMKRPEMKRNDMILTLVSFLPAIQLESVTSQLSKVFYERYVSVNLSTDVVE